MRVFHAVALGFAMLSAFSASPAIAQEYSLTEALSGANIPLTIRPSEIPNDFRAVKITLTGNGDAYGLDGILPAMVGTAAMMDVGPTERMFLEILPISWTKGQIVTVVGQQYIVTYGIELGINTLKSMSGTKKLPAFNLRLKLIRTSDIGSIVPLPEWGKEKYLRAMSQVADLHIGSVVEARTQERTNPIPAPPIVSSQPPVIPSPPIVSTQQNPVKSGEPQHQKGQPETGNQGNAVKVSTPPSTSDAQLYSRAQDNAKSMASAMLLYAQDYDETFPYVQGTKGAEFVIYPYVKSMDVYKTLNPVRGGEFRFNMCLAGVTMNEITDPAATPLFYDPFAWPNGTYLVAFADSHVKFLSPDEWEKAKSKLILKLKRRGSPLPLNYVLPNPPGSGGPPGNK